MQAAGQIKTEHRLKRVGGKVGDEHAGGGAAGELGRASDEMMAHPLALQLRNLQTMVEIGVDKNSTIMFPAPLMSTIGEIGAFLSREAAASVNGSANTPLDPR